MNEPRRTRLVSLAIVVSVVVLPFVTLTAQVSFDRILRAAAEPQNWLTYSGTTMSQRYSLLTQMTPANVKNLEQQWVFQAQSLEKFEATPLVVDGVLYTVQPPNDIVALDAQTGRIYWAYSYRPSPQARLCCGRVNRGLAILGDSLFMGTIDGHLVAVNAKSGRLIWDAALARPEAGYSLTLAPLVVKDKVIVGPAGGEYGIRGFLAAFDAKTGKELYKFKTPSGIIGNVMTYEQGGKQYVAVLSGVGGWAGTGLAAGLTDPTAGLGAVGGYAALSNYTALGGSLTVFALP